MTRRKNSLKSLVMGLLLAFVCPVCAQVTGSKVFPLHVEASFESGTSYHKMMPMGAVADLGYYINRFSLPDFVIASPKNPHQRVWRFSDALPSTLSECIHPCS